MINKVSKLNLRGKTIEDIEVFSDSIMIKTADGLKWRIKMIDKNVLEERIKILEDYIDVTTETFAVDKANMIHLTYEGNIGEHEWFHEGLKDRYKGRLEALKELNKEIPED